MHPWEYEQWLPGVLSKKQMKVLVDNSYIGGVDNFERGVDHSSLDLHITSEGYRLIKGSIKPHGSTYEQYLRRDDLSERLITDNDCCFKLRKNECYVFRLQERLYPNLGKSNIYGQATAKSSIGRLDVIARLIVDGMHEYESFRPKDIANATGNMYLEIIPISFNIRVKEGSSLSQLRFFLGKVEDSIINDKGFIKTILHGTEPESEQGEGFLSVDLSNIKIGGLDVAAFRAFDQDDNNIYIDLWELNEENKPNPCNFWCFDRTGEDNRLKIKNGSFYILRSKERISLPAGVAVYCRAMDETLGEMRIHYAGFAHPFFGFDRHDGQKGTPLIFEVRGHNVDVSLNHQERLAKLIFYRMSEVSYKEGTVVTDKVPQKKSNYGSQELTLSKYFADWPNKLKIDEDGRVSEA